MSRKYLSSHLSKVLSFCVTLFLCNSILAQNGVVKDYYPDGAVKCEVTYANGVLDGNAIQYYPNAKIKSEKNFSNGIVQGLVKEYYDSGLLKEEYYVKDGIKDGTYKSYYGNGTLKDIINYSSGMQTQKTSFNLDPNIPTPVVLNEVIQPSVEKKIDIAVATKNDNEVVKTEIPKKEIESVTEKIIDAAPIGGIKAIQDSLVYPEHAIRYGLQGTVTLIASISADGEVIDTQIKNGLGFGCSEAAEDAVRKIKYIPARKSGQPIESKLTLNIEFKIFGTKPK